MYKNPEKSIWKLSYFLIGCGEAIIGFFVVNYGIGFEQI